MVLQALKEGKERREPREMLVLKVHLARQAQWVHRDHQENPDLKVCEEFRVLLASKVCPVLPAQQVLLAQWVLLDYQASRVIPE